MSSVCRGLISVAGAAHVCGVISLILSDDDYAVKQAQLKSVLMARFSETAEIKTAGQVPIRVLKKFMQSVKKQSKSHLSSAYHVSTEAPDNTTLTIQRLVSTGIPSSPLNGVLTKAHSLLENTKSSYVTPIASIRPCSTKANLQSSWLRFKLKHPISKPWPRYLGMAPSMGKVQLRRQFPR